MRKIIDGKVYDTRTAKLLGEWCKPHSSRRDFSYYEESLHINRRGAYFLYGRGGGMSPYATHSGDGSSSGWGEQLEPMTQAEAMAWAETALSAEQYESIFGEAEEADPSELRERVNFVLDPRQLEGLRRLSKQSGVPMSRIVERALETAHGPQFEELLTTVDPHEAAYEAKADAEILALTYGPNG